MWSHTQESQHTFTLHPPQPTNWQLTDIPSHAKLAMDYGCQFLRSGLPTQQINTRYLETIYHWR